MEFKCMFATEPVSDCPPVKELDRLREENRRLEEENKRLRAFDSGEKISPLASLGRDDKGGGALVLGRDDNGGGQDDRGEQL